MMRKIFLLTFLVLFFLDPVSVFGQKWLTRQYTGLDGLPSSNVLDIAQDPSGCIWFATRAGISCYDGIEWKNFTISEGLPTLTFYKINVDKKGRVWALPDINSGGKLPIIYSTGSGWSQVSPLEVQLVSKHDVISFHSLVRNGQTVLATCTANSGFFLRKRDTWRRWSAENGLLSDSLKGSVVLEDSYYICTHKGLSILGPGDKLRNRSLKSLGFPGKRLTGIALEDGRRYPAGPQKNRLWFFGDRFLGCLEKGSERPNYYDTGIRFFKRERQVTILPDYRSGVFIATKNEIFYFNYKTGKSRQVTTSNGLISEGANAMFIDFEKNVWIACDRGVTKIQSRRFSSFQRGHGMLEDEVTAVLEYEPGKFVFGHNRGITFMEGLRFTSMSFAGKAVGNPQLCRVLDMAADSRDNIWVALSNVGLVKIDTRKKTTWYGKAQGLPESPSCLWIDSRDRVWLAVGKDILRIDPGSRRAVVQDNFPPVRMRRIFGRGDKLRFMAGYNAGVYVFRQGSWQNYAIKGKKNANSVYAVLPFARDRLLVGTLDGLYVIEKERMYKFNENGFLIDRPTYFILKDKNGHFWFGTDNGVLRWDGDHSIRYSITEGLLGRETNRAAGLVDYAGRIWIGTNRGVSVYREEFDNFLEANPAPRVRLLELETTNYKALLEKPVEVSYKHVQFSIRFRAVSFLDEKDIAFSHKLEGFDRDWTPVHKSYNQVVKYANLPPGTYRFHLKARNSLGVWSDVVSSAPITILEPFYKTWLFFFVLIVGPGVIFYSYFRFASTRRNARRLERLVRERTSQLEESERNYRELFEDSQDMVLITSLDGRILDINPAGTKLLGYEDKDEALALDVRRDLYHNPGDRDRFMKEIKERGGVKEYEQHFKKKNGEEIIATVTATYVPGANNREGSIRGIVRDITARRKLQQQLTHAQKMEAIGTLAGGIAHDFNNILAIISGYLELSRDGLEQGDYSQIGNHITHMEKSTNRARDLVKQILAFSRYSSQQRKILNVCRIVEESLMLLRSTLPSTIDLKTDLEAKSTTVQADATQIQQVVMNLCTNSAYAMRERGGVLEVGLHEIELDEEEARAYNKIPPGTYLRITVGDTGHGIDQAIIKRIFDPYFTTKKAGEGTGLGLAVIHGIVKGHDGEIKVYSEPGKGTTFHVLLPVSSGKPRKSPGKESKKIPRGRGERILLVDDEPLLVEVEAQFLRNLNYKVTPQTAGPEAFQAFSSDPQQFDLVITDLTMPQLTGIQLARKIRAIREDIPIILCTGFSEKVNKRKTRHLGIYEFLMKPVSRNHMAQAVRSALGQNAVK